MVQCEVICYPKSGQKGYLDGIAEREVGRELQVAQAHARDRAGPVALGQPALDAHPVIRVPCCHHHRIRHELLQQGERLQVKHTAKNMMHCSVCPVSQRLMRTLPCLYPLPTSQTQVTPQLSCCDIRSLQVVSNGKSLLSVQLRCPACQYDLGAAPSSGSLLQHLTGQKISDHRPHRWGAGRLSRTMLMGQ